MQKNFSRKNIFDVIEGYYLSQFLIHLNRLGYFTSRGLLKEKLPANIINLLHVLSERTDIIKKVKGRFVVAEPYRPYTGLGFHIDKLLQAYGNVEAGKKDFRLSIDEQQFALAYKKVYPYQDWSFLLDIIKGLPVQHLLDLGCGAGALTLQFCNMKKANTALGIDASKEMCSTARQFTRAAKLSSRVKIYCGLAEDFDSILPAAALQKTDIIVAGNLFNELFDGGGAAAIGLLKRLKKFFPGRYLMVVDYYGMLGTRRSGDPARTHNYVHDMIQLFSGQGVPPAGYKQWNKLYKSAGCKLEEVLEGQSQGVNWFVHKLLL